MALVGPRMALLPSARTSSAAKCCFAPPPPPSTASGWRARTPAPNRAEEAPRQRGSAASVFTPARPEIRPTSAPREGVQEEKRVRQQLRQLLWKHSDRFMSWEGEEEADGVLTLASSAALESLAVPEGASTAAAGPTTGPSQIMQGYAAVRGTKGGPSRPCQDFFVAFNQHSPLGARRPPDGMGHLSKPLCVSAVFDGHGVGEHAPLKAQASTLPSIAANADLMHSFETGASTSELDDEEILKVQAGFSRLYSDLDGQILRESAAAGNNNGATALVTVCCGAKLYCSNAGDTRAVLCRDGQALRLSRDHTPGLPEERARIEAAGGAGSVQRFHNEQRVVLANGSTRKICAISRALGDRDFKVAGLMVSEPDVSLAVLKPSRDAFFIAASDGLWGRVSDQQAVDVVRDVLRQAALAPGVPRQVVANFAARTLVDMARAWGSTDDITVIVNVLHWD